MERAARSALVLPCTGVLVGLCTVVLSGACSLLVSTSGLVGPPLAVADDGGPALADGAPDVGTIPVVPGLDAATDAALACPTGLQGPSMVRVDDFCIDATEVTSAQYAKFVASKNGDASGQPAVCSWNGSYVPAASCTSLATADGAPVACVDWCDAFAYCAWAGKRLCGRIGGGPNTAALASAADSDQWYRACSHAGEHKYPYGDTYAAQACNDAARGTNAPVAVGTSPNCEGGYAGLFDMSGNVVEWTDNCKGSTGATDGCQIRGGAYDDDGTSTFLECATASGNSRQSVDPTKGFRCCT